MGKRHKKKVRARTFANGYLEKNTFEFVLNQIYLLFIIISVFSCIFFVLVKMYDRNIIWFEKDT